MKRKRDQPYGSRITERRLDLLFGEEADFTPQSVPLEKLRLPDSQPRRYFDSDALQDLIASVKQHGILQPLLIRPLEGDHYELVAGERRYRAAQALGLTEVPVVVRELSRQEALQLALIENLQREDLNPVEETEGILQLLSLRLSKSQEEVTSLLYRMNNELKNSVNHNVMVSESGQLIQEVFEALGQMKWDSFVSNRLPVLKLPPEILESLRAGKIAYTKARALAKVKDEPTRQSLLAEVIQDNLSLKQIREQIKSLQPQPDSFPEHFSQRLTTVSRLVKKKSPLWSDPKKRQKLESLLKQLEALTGQE